MGVQVKLWTPLRTRAILERFCGGHSLRRGAISTVCTFAECKSVAFTTEPRQLVHWTMLKHYLMSGASVPVRILADRFRRTVLDGSSRRNTDCWNSATLCVTAYNVSQLILCRSAPTTCLALTWRCFNHRQRRASFVHNLDYTLLGGWVALSIMLYDTG